MAEGGQTPRSVLTRPQPVDLFTAPLNLEVDPDQSLTDLQLYPDFISRLSQFGQSLASLPISPEQQTGQRGFFDNSSSEESESGSSVPEFLAQQPGRPTISSNTANQPTSATTLSASPAPSSCSGRGRSTSAQRSVAPGQSMRAVAPGQSVRAVAPGQSVRAVAPGQSVRAVAPGQSVRAVAPGQSVRAVAPGQSVRAVANTPSRGSAPPRPPQTSRQSHRPGQQQPPSHNAAARARRPQTVSVLTTSGEDEEVSCPICTESRRYLKKLPCEHCFCEYCLQRIVNEHERNPSRHFPCPFCRATTAIPERGASDFPISIAGGSQCLRLAEVAPALNRVQTLHQEGQGACQGCGEEAGRYTCMQCQTLVCDYCRHDHPRHPLLLLPASLHSFRAHTAQGDPHCPRHPARPLRAFCSTCGVPLCQLCQRGAHATHQTQDLRQAAASARDFLENTQRDVERGLRLLHSALEHAKREKRLTLRELSKSQQTIRSRAAEARAVIDQCEKAALGTLRDRREAFQSKRQQELNDIQGKQAAMSAILSHMERVILANREPELVSMQVSASDTIGKEGFLDKYTNNLPFYRYNVEMKHETFARFTEAAKRWIGSPAMAVAPSAVDVVRVVADVPVLVEGTDTMTLLSVCPVGDYNAWLAYQHGDAALTVIAQFHLGTGRVSWVCPVDVPVSLVKLGQGLALATLRNSQTVLMLEGQHEELPSAKAYHKILFAKGELRACLRVAPARHEPDVRHADLLVDVQTAHGVVSAGSEAQRLWGLQDPRTMDVSRDGRLAAIVDGADTLQVVKRGAARPHMALTTRHNAKVLSAIADVCFCTLGGREVLLLADPFQDDVLVLDVSKDRCSLLGFLTNMTGRLQHPSAFNVDPTKGTIYVACGGKSIVVCADTGAQLCEGTGWHPTHLKTK
ncbi:hypothetical protein ACOMHN_016821 [Nucella lapillus]